MKISLQLIDEMVAHAREDLPNECCGLLAGRIENGVGTVTTRFTIANTLRSPTEFETDPRGMIVVFRHMREHALELLAIYHSHPASEPVPNRLDADDTSERNRRTASAGVRCSSSKSIGT